LLSVTDILSDIKKISQGVKKITLTGGEPLESSGKALTTLIQELLLDGYYITIETNGLHSPDELLKVASLMGRNRQLSMILDWKLPSAGKVSEKIKRSHYVDLPHNCFVKFVISDRTDFDAAIEAASFIRKISDAQLYFSPCADDIELSTLFNWMKGSVCPSWGIGYNLQLHKYLFADDWRDEEVG
jgi:organic radical activating enzyme